MNGHLATAARRPSEAGGVGELADRRAALAGGEPDPLPGESVAAEADPPPQAGLRGEDRSPGMASRAADPDGVRAPEGGSPRAQDGARRSTGGTGESPASAAVVPSGRAG